MPRNKESAYTIERRHREQRLAPVNELTEARADLKFAEAALKQAKLDWATCNNRVLALEKKQVKK